MTPVLQSASFPITRWEECFKAYEEIHNRRLNEGTQLCAGTEGNDACSGDSGGALVVRPRDGRDNVHYQECILFSTSWIWFTSMTESIRNCFRWESFHLATRGVEVVFPESILGSRGSQIGYEETCETELHTLCLKTK